MPLPELEQAYLDQTKRFGSVVAALGIMGDESLEEMTARAKKVVQDRKLLLAAAIAVRESAKPSLGQVWILPSTFWRLENAIENAQKPLP